MSGKFIMFNGSLVNTRYIKEISLSLGSKVFLEIYTPNLDNNLK
jgi:hypothetical protein